MSKVNFSIPDAIKKAFNKAFEGENKSAVLARLMQQAIEERKRLKRRAAAFRLLTKGREKRTKLSNEKFRRLREKGRS